MSKNSLLLLVTYLLTLACFFGRHWFVARVWFQPKQGQGRLVEWVLLELLCVPVNRHLIEESGRLRLLQVAKGALRVFDSLKAQLLVGHR